MGELDCIESKISLLDDIIDFDEIVDDFLSESFKEEDRLQSDEINHKKNYYRSLNYRFTTIYNLDILHPDNGYSQLHVNSDNENKVKRYLHRFLTLKDLNGGENANTDGSAELFECISANAVKNYLGQDSNIIMVGEGKSNLTESKLKEIIDQMKEKTGSFCHLPDQAKDDGVDFIVYKPLDPRNVGNNVFLGQACVGKHYQYKRSIADRWRSEYITFAVKPPTTILSVVCFLEQDQLRKVHSNFSGSIIFDRGRILRYYDISDDELNKRIINHIDNITFEEM